MKIAIGNDHRGYRLKREILSRFDKNEFVDMGSHSTQRVDYPDFAHAVTDKVASGECERGILICASGVGMSIAANKVSGIRASLIWEPKQAALTRQHNDSNVLCLASDFIDEEKAFQIVETWLKTPFEGGRHQERLNKIRQKK